MDNKQTNVTISEAQLAIDSVNKIKRDTIKSVRLPIWLIALAAISTGLLTYSISYYEQAIIWIILTYVSAAIILCFVIYSDFYFKSKGKAVNSIPVNSSGRILFCADAIVITVLIVASRALYLDGAMWAPMTFAIVSIINCFLVMHYFPNYQWAKPASSSSKIIKQNTENSRDKNLGSLK